MRYVPFDKSRVNGKTNSGCALIFLVVAVAYILTALPNATSAHSVTSRDACYMAQEFVSDSLKAPATAEFAACNGPDTHISGANTGWRVQSHVDAQNSFGAMLRTHYDVSLSYEPTTETWRLTNLVTD